ncbi:MAG: XRE family transcriptional regulator [Micavibrio sp.]|jgi:transcriptional regulator with XRE-family HTH domain|nr:MAG: XRE family transcriptional regulator [Micavibrio sp.]
MPDKISKKGRPSNSQTHPVDRHVGRQLRARRLFMGMSQTALAKAVGLTFQQIQKYERAANRVSASRLYDFCKVLDVDFEYFFDGLDGRGRARREQLQKGFADGEDQAGFEGGNDLMTRRETIDLLRAYYSIDDPKLRRQILQMARTLAKASFDEDEDAVTEQRGRGRPRKNTDA